MKGAIWKKDELVPKLWMEKLRLSTRTVVKNETDLKEKRRFSPWQLTFWLIVNVRNMNVIFPRLHPMPINRWTVTPYCSRWLVITRTSFSDFYLLSSRRYKCNLILSMFVHYYIMLIWIIWWFNMFTCTLSVLRMFLFMLTYRNDEGMSFMTFVKRSLYPKGDNASKGEGL